jgi:drug/metabolite transporter (DMT)-like permease
MSKTIAGPPETVGLFLLAPAVMTLNLVLARALSGSVPPLTLSFARWTIAVFLLWPFVRREGWAAIRAQPRDRIFFLGLLGGALTVGPQYVATTLTTPAHVGLIFASTPLLVVTMEWGLWSARVARTTILGAVVALGGVAFSSLKAHHSAGASPLLGDMLALCGAIGWAGYTSFLRHRPVQLEPLQLLWSVAAGGASLLALPALAELAVGQACHWTLQTALLVLAIAIVASILVYFFYGKLVKSAGASIASASMFLVPIYAMIEAWAFERHVIEVSDLVGLASIVFGTIMLLLEKQNRV